MLTPTMSTVVAGPIPPRVMSSSVHPMIVSSRFGKSQDALGVFTGMTIFSQGSSIVRIFAKTFRCSGWPHGRNHLCFS